jgi:hypothetical protein
MIHYQLRCSEAHEFDGWFKDSATFDRQAELGLVECPTCGDVKVERALMAPSVSTRTALPAPSPGPEREPETPAGTAVVPRPVPAVPPQVVAKLPAQMVAVLQRMRAEVEKNCDYVGPEFADEARKMHRGESEKRGIYGETTPDEAEALAEEGIQIASIPWVPQADS